MEKANPLFRLIAVIIDAIILWIPQSILMVIFVGSVSIMPPTDPQQIGPWIQQLMAANGIVNLLMIVIAITYFSIFWVKKGATPGKLLMGIKVVKVDGSPITYGDAILRYIGYIVDAIVCCLGYIWILFDPIGQGWHDKIAKTRVIKAK